MKCVMKYPVSKGIHNVRHEVHVRVWCTASVCAILLSERVVATAMLIVVTLAIAGAGPVRAITITHKR
eukprot:scaffold203_cov386-Prasinococcus_capsulatus_cf.AAC.26